MAKQFFMGPLHAHKEEMKRKLFTYSMAFLKIFVIIIRFKILAYKRGIHLCSIIYSKGFLDILK